MVQFEDRLTSMRNPKCKSLHVALKFKTFVF